MNIIKKVYSFAVDGKRYMIKAVILLSISAIFSIIPYYVVYRIIVMITSDTLTIHQCIISGTIIFITTIIRNITNEYGLKASHHLAYTTLMGMRQQATNKLLVMPMGEVDKYGSGELKKVFVENIESMELILAHGIPEGMGNVLGIIVVIIAMFVSNWILALCTLAVIPLGFLVLMIMGINAAEKLDQFYQSSKNMNDRIIEYVRGMEVIKVFGQESTSFVKYRQSIKDYKQFSLQWYKSCWKYMSIYGVILPSPLLFVLPMSIVLYVNGSLTFPVLVLSILLCMAIGPMFMKLVVFMPMIPTLKLKYERIETLYQETELLSGSITQIPDTHTITFKDVTFSYSDKEVIKHLHFQANQGSITALVGESGAGKSTIAKLITRFWDVNSGGIYYGDTNIKEYDFNFLMSKISYVSQDNFLFDTTIMENIRYGKPEATDSKIIEIVKRAKCHDFIAALPQGYHTHVGEAGDKLSGGQRQRITIARAILKDSPVIILDEATSCTDAENEYLIQEALNELLKTKTVIVIAHRLSTIVEADQIIVLQQGEIIAQGKHLELLDCSSDYKQMWESYQQSADWEYKNTGGEFLCYE